jgi:hypothetical protein
MACGVVIGLVTEAVGAAWTLRERKEEIRVVREVKEEVKKKEEKTGPKVEVRQRKEL